MNAMILAAGEGTRLRPLTLDRPKPMLPVAGRPLLEYTVAWLLHHGVRHVVMNLHHRGDVVMDHFGDGSRVGVAIEYSLEEILLGTAGAVKRVEHLFVESPFLVVYGDVLTDLNLAGLVAYHLQAEPALPHITMALYHVSNPWQCGVVLLDPTGHVVRFVEKPPRHQMFSNLANAGVLVVDPAILKHVPEARFYDFGNDLIPWMLRNDLPVHGWIVPDDCYLVDIGTPEKYAQVQREWPTPRARAFLRQQGSNS